MKSNDIIQQLHKMKTQAPSAEWKMSCEKKFISLMRNNAPEKKISLWSVFFNIVFGSVRSIVLQPTVILLLVLATAFGSSLLVNAAFYSLPGDQLYPLKIRLEKAQIAFMSNKNDITELKVEFAKKRLYEIDKIMLQPEEPVEKEKKVYIAVNTLKQNIKSFKDDVEKNIPEKEMNLKIALSLNSTSKELAKTLENQVALGNDAKKNVESAKDMADDAGLQALIGSISQENSTTTKATDNGLKNSEDIKNLITQKIQDAENKYAELEKKYGQSQDKDVINSFKEVKKLLEQIQTDFARENYDMVLKNIQAIKKIFRNIEGLDKVSDNNIDSGSGDAVKAVTTDNY